MAERFPFHAAAPGGHFINDPNGLVYSGGRWRLFVQHRDDPPAFERTGWARLSSEDLLRWTWDGAVIEPDPEGWAWSGGVRVLQGGRLEAIYTRHAAPPDAPWEVQRRAWSDDAGLSWTSAPGLQAPAGRNARDPFVFAGANGAPMMLLARPCGWTGWEHEPPSTIELLSSSDWARWETVGVIGPWAPLGVMWEVPVLLRLKASDAWALLVCVTDRRPGRAGDGGVRYWIGSLDGAGFEPRPGQPAEGRPLDLGPDFQVAMIQSLGDGEPAGDQLIVGWASNWTTAGRIAWPGAAGGGPISLPRRLGFDDETGRLTQAPIGAAAPYAALQATLSGDEAFSIRAERGSASLCIEGRPRERRLSVERIGVDPALSWAKRHERVLRPCSRREVQVFVDGPLIEVFVQPDGLSVTLALDGKGDVGEVRLSGGQVSSCSAGLAAHPASDAVGPIGRSTLPDSRS